MRLRPGNVTVADVLASQPVTTNLLKFILFLIIMRRLSSTLFPYTTLFRSSVRVSRLIATTRPAVGATALARVVSCETICRDRKSTRLNSSHLGISYAVFCLKKKKHDAVQPDIEAERKKRDEIEAGKRYCS